MTTLRDIAHSMRKQAWSYVPLMIPLWITMIGIYLLEAIARIIKVKPFASAVQIAFLTKGWKPDPSKAIRELGWKPMPLEEGIRRFLAARRFSRSNGLHAAAAALPMTGSERVGVIAKLELFTAAGLLLYWVLFFTVGVAPENPPPGYFVFQNSFTFADLILAGVLTRAATFLLGADPALAKLKLALHCCIVNALRAVRA